ncbi:MAG: hypothetical protein COB34_02025 [Methylophilaceae bacterium]|nr:MAG: hypothetical protein COB34_02025 [Methylophilaceae bacterium]
MKYLIIKYLITAGVVVVVSELAKRSDKLGGLLAALPIVTVLTLIWLFVEKQPDAKIANHAYYTFWYVIPTLPMFLLFPYALPKLGFWLALTVSILLTLIVFFVFIFIVKQFGVELF